MFKNGNKKSTTFFRGYTILFFYKGRSHSAHIYEPFGYSIFQAIDYGKLPILSEDWLPNIEYPYRASTKEKFEEVYKDICNVNVVARQTLLQYLRSNLLKYDNKEEWANKYLEIYNSWYL